METVHTPTLALLPVAAEFPSSVYVPAFSELVYCVASAGGHCRSGRHTPSLVWTANGGSTTDGSMPLRYWS